MNNKEQLAKEYADRFGYDASGMEEEDFLEGYNAAIKNLKQIVQQLQKEQITSTVYILREVIKRMEDE